MADRIEKRMELKAPVSRVWRALTDYREFGEWFRVKLDGAPSYRAKSQVGALPIPATSTSNGKSCCKPWNPNGSFPSLGILDFVSGQWDRALAQAQSRSS